jgi:hypothetical protein
MRPKVVRFAISVEEREIPRKDAWPRRSLEETVDDETEEMCSL